MDIIFSFPFLSIFVTSFSIGTEKVCPFSMFSPRHSNCPSNYFANFFIVKKQLYLTSSDKLQEFC